ncbi:MAG TPA: HNH endonuclease signature motif containing protein [Candidatus Acidoferrum sp.]
MAPPVESVSERLARWSLIDPLTGCHIWLGGVSTGGYAKIKVFGRTRKAATVAYELTKGPVPTGLVIDHKCHHPNCINPDHLEAVTQSENLRRRRAFSRYKGNTCKRGHSLPPLEERNKNGSCPICYAEYQAEWKSNNKQYEVDYREANKDRINANRRAKRALARKERF